jgi:hypothetical protein
MGLGQCWEETEARSLPTLSTGQEKDEKQTRDERAGRRAGDLQNL